jgi:hypothetical protein
MSSSASFVQMNGLAAVVIGVDEAADCIGGNFRGPEGIAADDPRPFRQTA